MPDREKVIKALEFCTDQRIVDTCYGECPYAVADDEYKCLQMKLDALALLKEQEHKDKMFHALEEDWKRLKAILKEQEQTIDNLNKTVKELLQQIADIKEYMTPIGKVKDVEAVAEMLKEQEAVAQTWQQGKAYCGSCGKRIPLKIGARFCHKCGKRVQWE